MRPRAWTETARAIIAAARQVNAPCSLCGGDIEWDAKPKSSKAPSVDHRRPLGQGGTDHLSNLAPAHYGCNSGKRDRLQPNRSRVW